MPTLPINPWSKAFGASSSSIPTDARVGAKDQRPEIANTPSVRKYQAQKTLEPILDTILGLSPINALAQAASYVPEAEAAPDKSGALSIINKAKKALGTLSEDFISRYNVKAHDEPLFSDWDTEKRWPNTHTIIPPGRTESIPTTLDNLSLLQKRMLQDDKFARKKIVPPSSEDLDRLNMAGKGEFGPEYIPYEGGDIHSVTLPVEKFLKKYPRTTSLDNSYNYDIAVQGLAHGVDNQGKFLNLNSPEEILSAEFPIVIGGHTDQPSKTIWKLTKKPGYADGGSVRPGVLTRYMETQPQRQAEAARKSSVMSKAPPTERWQPEYEVEPGLEAPMFSPDDLIGSGIPTKLAMLAKSMSPLAMIGGVIKNKGGNWLEGSVEGALKGLRKSELSPDAITQEMRATNNPAINQELARRLKDTAINQWIDKPLRNYVRNEMATPEDPIRALAERGVLHVDPDTLRQMSEHTRNSFGTPEEWLNISRSESPQLRNTILGKSPAARSWEDATDSQLSVRKASDIDDVSGFDYDRYPWAKPETIISDFPDWSNDPSRYFSQDLGFNHLIDELSNAINPESGLPRHLQFPADRLSKVSVPQAVERVDAINKWRAAMKAEADQAKANNAATVLHKEYPEQGMKWVELTSNKDIPAEGYKITPIDAKNRRYWKVEGPGFKYPSSANTEAEAIAMTHKPALADALKYEGDTMGHCVGGYCDDVASGRSRIYSLRDAKGQPHVTIEVQPQGLKYDRVAPEMGDRDLMADMGDRMTPAQSRKFQNWLENEYAGEDLSKEVIGTPWEKFLPPVIETPRIVQIKGKQNLAPNPEYLPMVQDFVKSGKWSDVGDLQNTGLVEHLNKPGIYITQEEASTLMKRPFDEGFAHGGSVRPNKIETVADLSAIIRAIQSGN